MIASPHPDPDALVGEERVVENGSWRNLYYDGEGDCVADAEHSAIRFGTLGYRDQFLHTHLCVVNILVGIVVRWGARSVRVMDGGPILETGERIEIGRHCHRRRGSDIVYGK